MTDRKDGSKGRCWHEYFWNATAQRFFFFWAGGGLIAFPLFALGLEQKTYLVLRTNTTMQIPHSFHELYSKPFSIFRESPFPLPFIPSL